MADLSHWDIAIDFTGEEAAALAVGIDPAQPQFHRTKSKPLYGRMEHHFNGAKRLYREEVQQSDGPPLMEKSEVLASIDLLRLDTDEDPELGGYFQRWFLDNKLSGFATQRFTRQEIVRWMSTMGIQSIYQFDSAQNNAMAQEEKVLNPKERDTLLKLVIGMAVGAYGYDPVAAKSSIPNEIVNDLESLGLSITDDTVRKYLKEGATKFIPDKPIKL